MNVSATISPAARAQSLEPRAQSQAQRAFTMIEIAICLAIIGVALVGIIGVLPYGMNTQRDNREETIIGQDANLLTELITSGSRGANDLTNYIYAITNYWGSYDKNGNFLASGVNSYTYLAAYELGNSVPLKALNNGTNIIGVLSTPQFTALSQSGLLRAVTNLYLGGSYQIGYSNHVVAYVRSMSGLATEKPPQDNSIMLGDAFTYRLFVVNAPVAQDSNTVGQAYSQSLNATLHDLRLTFFWPLLPNGNTGSGRHTFRTSVAGDLRPDSVNGFFFYNPQTFTAAP